MKLNVQTEARKHPREGQISNEKGFTLIELLIVIAIVGILASIAIPVFSQYKARAHDAQSKAELHNIFLACKGYWADTGPVGDCSVATITGPDYGFQQSNGITVTASGNETTFTASATHINTGKTYTVDAKGTITP